MLKMLQHHPHLPSPNFSNKENLSAFKEDPLQKKQLDANPEEIKQKLELCKKFIEFGFCPFR